MTQDVTYTNFGMVEETVYGTTPASALQLLNLTNFPAFNRVRSASRPEVLTGDRRRYPNVELQLDGTLGLQSVLQYGNMLQLMEGLMANDQDSPVSISAATISVVGTTGVISDSGSGFGSLQDGDLVYISGSLNGLNDGWKGPVTSAAAGNFTVPSSQVVDETAGETIAIKTTRLLDANTPKSYSAEWHATQLTTKFLSGVGYRVSSGNWTWQSGSFVEESYELMGLAPVGGSSTIGTGGPTAAVTNQFLGPVSDFGKLYVSGVETTYKVSQINLSATNAISPNYSLGSAGPDALSTGPMDISLGATVIYDNNSDTLRGNIEDFDTISLWWDVLDQAGNRFAFSLPAVKADVGDPSGGAPGSFIEIANASFSAHDPTKDPNSAYYTDAFGYQFGIYMVAA